MSTLNSMDKALDTMNKLLHSLTLIREWLLWAWHNCYTAAAGAAWIVLHVADNVFAEETTILFHHTHEAKQFIDMTQLGLFVQPTLEETVASPRASHSVLHGLMLGRTFAVMHTSRATCNWLLTYNLYKLWNSIFSLW